MFRLSKFCTSASLFKTSHRLTLSPPDKSIDLKRRYRYASSFKVLHVCKPFQDFTPAYAFLPLEKVFKLYYYK
ncbi:MAG: hypothetical protein Q4E83_06240 [bacterium]|nr:hypothetical protein [bacterium]